MREAVDGGPEALYEALVGDQVSLDHRGDVVAVARDEALQFADDDVDHIENLDIEVHEGGVQVDGGAAQRAGGLYRGRGGETRSENYESGSLVLAVWGGGT